MILTRFLDDLVSILEQTLDDLVSILEQKWHRGTVQFFVILRTVLHNASQPNRLSPSMPSAKKKVRAFRPAHAAQFIIFVIWKACPPRHRRQYHHHHHHHHVGDVTSIWILFYTIFIDSHLCTNHETPTGTGTTENPWLRWPEPGFSGLGPPAS